MIAVLVADPTRCGCIAAIPGTCSLLRLGWRRLR